MKARKKAPTGTPPPLPAPAAAPAPSPSDADDAKTHRTGGGRPWRRAPFASTRRLLGGAVKDIGA